MPATGWTTSSSRSSVSRSLRHRGRWAFAAGARRGACGRGTDGRAGPGDRRRHRRSGCCCLVVWLFWFWLLFWLFWLPPLFRALLPPLLLALLPRLFCWLPPCWSPRVLLTVLLVAVCWSPRALARGRPAWAALLPAGCPSCDCPGLPLIGAWLPPSARRSTRLAGRTTALPARRSLGRLGRSLGGRLRRSLASGGDALRRRLQQSRQARCRWRCHRCGRRRWTRSRHGFASGALASGACGFRRPSPRRCRRTGAHGWRRSDRPCACRTCP